MWEDRLSDGSRWQAALEHYQWDRLEDAFALIRNHGVGESGRMLGNYRLIEAELITRRKGTVLKVNDWLSIEYVVDDVMGHEGDLANRVLAACEDIAQRLDWRHGPKTRLAVLAEETDADWATYPFGYVAQKEPYEKICLPNYLLDDLDEFHRAVAHEYAHVISSHLSDGHAPRWLEEAMSVLAEGTIDEQVALAFRTGEYKWLNPDDLERVLESRGDDENDLEMTLRAYQQCGWIGRFLSTLGGDSKLRDMLVAHTNDGVIDNLRLRLLGRERVDGAMRSVYGRSLSQVFDESLRFLLGS